VSLDHATRPWRNPFADYSSFFFESISSGLDADTMLLRRDFFPTSGPGGQ
jgi:hypothetical protein